MAVSDADSTVTANDETSIAEEVNLTTSKAGQNGAFDRLPDELIQHILYLSEPSAFASLVLINSKWWSAGQEARLYAQQLLRCPSFAASHKTIRETQLHDLPLLRRLFAREVKRNLFDAYLRPHKTNITIVSNAISSSSAPGGDGIAFQPSPNGWWLLAYNSSRLYVLDVRKKEVEVRRELRLLRRPAATCITNDGAQLAVLLSEMQVDIYDLSHTPPKRTQSLILDHNPRAIALSPCGTVLAAAYEGGIEVSSLDSQALDTDRRSVKCDGVDALAFSRDGTQIIGTTAQAAQANTVILTAPYYDPGSHQEREAASALWTTSILFPNSSRDCSHAVLLQDSDREEAMWTLTYDRSFETFRAVRVDDLRNGTTYFTGPIPEQATLLPCTLPTASFGGDLAAAGFASKDVWVYGIPEDLEAVPEPPVPDAEGSLGRKVSGSSTSTRSPRRLPEDDGVRTPQWQLLCDKYRNTFVEGHKVAELACASTLKWIGDFGGSSLQERLVIAAKGVAPPKQIADDDDEVNFVDGGRLTLVDFDYGLTDGTVTDLTIEVGTKEPEALEEEHRDMETEVAIVRRRTVAQQRGTSSVMIRAATTAARPTLSPRQEMPEEEEDHLIPRRLTEAPNRSTRPVSSEQMVAETFIEDQEALDAPYAHGTTRTVTTLHRAATAVANHRRHNPQTSTGHAIEVRRADGRAEHPHESDADNWVPPPPVYQKEATQDLPAFLRGQTPHTNREQSPDVPPVPSLPSHLQVGNEPPSGFVAPIPTAQGSSNAYDEDIYGTTPPSDPARMHMPRNRTGQLPEVPPLHTSTQRLPDLRGSMQVHDPHAPPSAMQLAQGSVGGQPLSQRPLSNSSTWPLQPPADINVAPPTAPYSAPAVRVDSMSSEGRYQDAFVRPQRISSLPTWREPSSRDVQNSSLGPPPDQPLIISTPAGIQGAFDDPSAPAPGHVPNQGIWAPVPHRPRPAEGPAGPRQPAAQHLEAGLAGADTRAPSRFGTLRIPSLKRRKSKPRPSISAKRNMAEAKRKGWRGRTKSIRSRGGSSAQVGYDPYQEMPPLPPQAPFVAAGTAGRHSDGWSDAGTHSSVVGTEVYGGQASGDQRAKRSKDDKKCVIM